MKTKEVIEELEPFLRKQCSKRRYEHIQRVAQTCAKLAKQFGVKKADAQLVGLAHDMVREWTPKKLLKLALSSGYKPRKAEEKQPMLLHGRCAALLLQRNFGVKNPSVLKALEDHTFGRKGMDKLGILLYVSDYIEPERKYISEKFRNKVMNLSPWEMVIAIHAHAEKRRKKMGPLTRQLHKYADDMLRKEGE
ncbi:MAG: bis(5'-nucleosyl)-tetraphosphatase (symmetrical) YqeK [Salinispira sp.]